MNTLQTIQQLKDKFDTGICATSEFLGEYTLEVKKNKLKEILAFLKQSPDPGFEVLMDLTGVDYLEPHKHTQVVYWLHNPSNLQRLRIKVLVERDAQLPSVSDLWGGAAWYERELYDLFGVGFSGHPDLKRILMPDNWTGHPLRKDYALTEEVVEFKHGVKPKVPSEIIPYVKNK